MKLGGLGMAGRGLRALFDGGATAGLSDRQLLARFAEGGGDGAAAEGAFEALMARHGPMVWGTCRRILRDPHAAEDAFQATFLILVRKAGSIRVEDSLGRWLHGVGVRVATRARLAGARDRPGPLGAIDPAGPSPPEAEAFDLRGVVDEEVDRLPAAYRSVVVLCHLEGLTRERAAARLGCPVGTVNSRLSRAGAMLKGRLARRGLAPASTALATWLGSTEGAAASSGPVPSGLSKATLALATRLAPGGPLAGVVPASVAVLVKGYLRGKSLMMLIPATIVSAALAGWAASGFAPKAEPGPEPGAAAKAVGPAQAPAAPIPPPNLAQQVKLTRAEWAASRAAYQARVAQAKTEAEREAAYATSTDDLVPFAGRFLLLAQADVKSPAARDALLWFCEQLWVGDGMDRWGSLRERALDLLAQHHFDSPEVALAGLRLYYAPSPARERFVRAMYDRAKDRKAKGYATLALALYRQRVSEGRRGRKLEARPHYFDKKGNIQYFDPEVEAAIRAERERDPVPPRLEAVGLYEEAIRDYGDVTYKLGLETVTIAGVAQEKLDAFLNLALGQPAREVEGADLDGKPLKLADYRGKVVALVFWASWCPPCVAEVPLAKALAGRYKGKPFALLGVNCDEDPEAARKAARDLGVDWPSWRDGSKIKGPCLIDMGPVASRYHVERLPAVFLVDAQGAIRAKARGLDGIDKQVDDLLKQAEGPPPSKPPAP